ncbi:hypothetical protein Pfo_009808 [Paulownia fortunei]|nr:hypothetical protein Pfo_009808 [Paulownia fortunei]
MAANRFATMLHRNTNKITLILIYAVLEWILIVLLLLNSLFSYLIIRFAEFFGLKPPCPWCTRIDHILDPARVNKNVHRDLLCEVHAKEISKLGYCSDHQKLVDSQDMCEDCLSSRPEFQGSSKNFALSPWMKEFGMIQNDRDKVGENGEISLNCSCCGVSLDNNKYSSYILLKTSSWDALECAQKENLITEVGDYDDNHIHEGCDSDQKVSDFAADLRDDEKVLVDKNESQMLSEFDGKVTEKETEENGCISVIVNELKESEGGKEEVDEVLEAEEERETLKEENLSLIMIDKSVQVCVEEDAPLEISPQHLEFFLDYSGHKLVPIELIDSVAEEHNSKENAKIEDDDKNKDQEFSLDSEVQVEEKEELVVERGSRIEKVDTFLDVDINEEPKYAMLDSMEIEEDENSLVFHAKDCHLVTKEFENFRVFPLARWPSEEASDVQELAGAPRERHLFVHTDNVACEEAAQANNENEADVSIGTEIPDLDITDEIQIQDSVHSYEFIHEDHSTSSANLYAVDDHGPTQVEEQQMVELQSLSVQDREHMMNNQPSFQLELNENEEDKVPDTPTSVDSLNQLHKKLLLLEKRDSGTEESLDGSVTSELEGSDGVVTIERLKSALRAERKALQALYAELEEERSSSAVAANQTMAMINRLQEEKAAMQMEALQYQRMMEEQSEYDQEALQLLNELMVKREKEKQELEKELEGYRKKHLDYETKEKMRILKKTKDGSTRSGFSSASCSNAEDSDGLSIDLNQEAKEEEGFYGHQEYGNQNTPVDAVVNLEESLADFEEERLSILEQLKVLEEKLLTLDDDKEQHFEDVKAMDNFHGENGNHVDENGHINGEANGHANGFSNEMMNGKHHQPRRIAGQKGKSLLPLFDAICDENGDVMQNGNGNGFDSNGVHDSYESKFEMENKKFAIEEEVDHLYERLQALEADREFLKHCISSLKKGDKGMDLLQEILQHLRDLRNVELRVRNLGDSAII